MRNQAKTAAFTIIELLFVIAIIGVIAALGASLVAKSAQRTKEQQAALQIKQILEASLTYYAKSSNWPQPYTDPSAECTSDFCTSFLPLYSLKDPWGGHYHWRTISGASTTFFEVYTDSYSNSALAASIASLLPNSSHTNSVVTAQVAPPGYFKQNGAIFGGAGTLTAIRGQDWVCAPYYCPLTAQQPHIYAGIKKIYTGFASGINHRVIQQIDINPTNEPCTPTNDPSAPGHKIYLILSFPGSAGTSALYDISTHQARLAITYVVDCKTTS